MTTLDRETDAVDRAALEAHVVALEAALKLAVTALPDLEPTIQWLEGGCNVLSAVQELRILESRITAANKALGAKP